MAVGQVGCIFCVLILGCSASARAQLTTDEPPIVPVVRYGSPEKLSAGIALQRDLGQFGANLIGSLNVGTGGAKAGLGLGEFGGNLMTGAALQLTVLRTFGHPTRVRPGQTFVGLEAEIMLFCLSFRVGPAVRIAGPDEGRRFLLNWGFGLGF